MEKVPGARILRRRRFSWGMREEEEIAAPLPATAAARGFL